MVSYRCIGYGITGNDGVATLDTNLDGTSIGEHSYTGSGVGELDFVASVDSPTQINSGSDVSQPYDVTDFKYVDTGIDGTASNIWSYTTLFTRGADGTVFTNPDATGQIAVYFKPNGSQQISLTDGLTFEFDLVNLTASNSGQFRLVIIDSQTQYIQLTQTGHYKLIFTDKLYVYRDGESFTTINYDTSHSNVQIGLNNTNKYVSIKFKNFGYY